LNGILNYWEYQASQVQRYRCTFWRWEYDPVMLPLNPNVAVTVAQGKIQYQAPDKGKFEVEELWDVAVQQQGETRVPILENENAKYVARQEVLDDHWVCDGEAIFQFDGRNKQIIKRLLPPEMKGKQIADGPLPFLFGAKAETLKQRYWIRVLPPRRQGVFRLEAVPKMQPDAADYRSIIVYIDEKEFLPEGLELIARAGGRTTFEFKDRETNWNLVPEMLTFWRQQFYEPKPPTGWKLVNEPVQGGPAIQPPPAAANSAPATPPRQAVKGPAAPPGRG
jgi:TIGR03009 family protein